MNFLLSPQTDWSISEPLSNALRDLRQREESLQDYTVLDFNACNITEEDIVFLAQIMQRPNCKIRHVLLSDNEISDKGATTLAEELKKTNCKILELALTNSLSPVGVEAIVDALKTNVHLDTIIFSSAISVSQICESTHFNMSSMHQVPIAVICALLQNPRCRILNADLSRSLAPWYTDTEAGYVSEALKSDKCKMVGLNLGSSFISAAGVSSMIDALKESVSLEFLIISGSRIPLVQSTFKVDQTRLDFLCALLQNPRSQISSLDLTRSTAYEDADAMLVAETLKSGNCKVRELDLGSSIISKGGMKSIASALTDEKCKLTEIKIGSYVGPHRFQCITDSLKNPNCKVTKLNLGSSDIGEEGARSLSDALKTNDVLETFVAFGTSISVKSIWNASHLTIDHTQVPIRLLSVLLQNPKCQVTSLNLSGLSKCTTAKVQLIADLLKSGASKVKELNFGSWKITEAAGVKVIANALKVPLCS